MKKRPFLLLLALAAMAAPAASCQCSRGEQQRRVETLEERSSRLQNGLDVELVAGPCGDASALVVVLNVGIDHDPPGRSGMAQLAARVLATSAPAGRAARTVEAGTDYTLYSVAAKGDQLFDELDEVAAWMSKTTPTEADLGRERAKMLEELSKLQGGDAAMTAASLAEESVLPVRGNGKRRGIAAEVQAITLAELQAFWQAHYKPGNARITAAGRFDPAKAWARIEAAFGPLPAGTPPVLREAATATVTGTLVMGETPTAVAVAVPAPALSDPLFAPFLVLAARLLEKPPQPRTWDVGYDPIQRPELLFITGPVGQGEQPEPAAGRMRTEASAILGRPLAAGETAKVRERFQLFLEPRKLDPAICAKDQRAFAVARARAAQLKLEAGLAQAVAAVTKEQLDEAAKLFEPKRTAAVIAGGAIR